MRQSIKRNYLLLIFAIASFSLHAQWGSWGSGIKGEGPRITKKLDLSKIDGIELSVPAKVYLSQGRKQQIEIKGQKNIINNIEQDVQRGIWEIEFKKNVKNMDDLTIYITIPDFSQLGISGAGSIIGKDAFTNLDDLKVSIAGSGDIEIEGTAEDLQVSIAGSGDIKLKDLEVNSCKVSIAGSGDCEINVATDLKVSIAGSGDVKYKGDPDKVKSSINGSGNVRSF